MLVLEYSIHSFALKMDFPIPVCLHFCGDGGVHSAMPQLLRKACKPTPQIPFLMPGAALNSCPVKKSSTELLLAPKHIAILPSEGRAPFVALNLTC